MQPGIIVNHMFIRDSFTFLIPRSLELGRSRRAIQPHQAPNPEIKAHHAVFL